MTKTLEIHYSQQADGFVEGRAYANPRFFSTPRNGATKVYIYGEYPNIEAAYLACDVEVVRVDPAPPSHVAATVTISTARPEDAASVEIPANWRDLPWTQGDGLTLRALASSISPTPVLNKKQAAAAVGGELVRRAKALGWVDGEPTVEQAESWIADILKHREADVPRDGLNGLTLREVHGALIDVGVEWPADISDADLLALYDLAQAEREQTPREFVA